MKTVEINHYKGHTIEWIEHLNAYRVYKDTQPQQTCFYCDHIREAHIVIDAVIERM